MKKKTAAEWIGAYSRKEIKGLIALVLVNCLGSAMGVSLAMFAKFIIDAAQQGDKVKLVRYAVLLVLVVGIQIALAVMSKTLNVKVSGRMEMKMKTDLFSGILKKDYLKISGYHSGELMTRLTSDIGLVCRSVVNILPNVASLVTKLVCAFVVLFCLDRMFAIVFLCAGVFLFIITKIFRGSIKRLHKKVQETDGKVRSFMQETIESILVIKIFNVSKKMCDKASELQKDNFDAKVKKNRLTVFANLGFSAAFSLGYIFGLVWSGMKLCEGAITFGTLTAIMQLVSQVQMPFTSLSAILPQYYSMLASAERIMEIERLESSVAKNSAEVDTKKLYDELESISFENISFSYDRDIVLDNVSFKINKEDFVVISGISGIGKSTLFKLLVGVIPPDEGDIRFNSGGGKYPVDKYTRPLFAYVPQGNMLFSGTIRDNIRFINESASDEEIMKAAEISCAADFIRELPEGLDTVLLESGHGLSEGQVQRLAIARAILTHAPIMLLDEATSALDEATEKKLLDNIRGLKEKTCIIISHKAAAYEICNKELKIENKDVIIRNLK